MEKNNEFGVILPNDSRNSAGGVCCEYGTVVRISHSESLGHGDLVPTIDGLMPRFIIETKGMCRFKVLSVHVSDAGYMEGVVQRIEDNEPEDDNPKDWNPQLLSKLCTEVRSFVHQMLDSVPEAAKEHFERKHGKMPDNPYDLSFWLAEFLPLNPYTLYTLLPLTSCVERLQIECEWIRRALQTARH